MIVLSVDPGQTTGVAIINGNRGFCILRSVDEVDLLDMLDAMILDVDLVILEGIPKFTLNLAQRRLYDTALAYSSKSLENCIILPGEWKPIAKARGWTHKEAKTQHEKDAYCMFRYWHLKTHKRDIGELPCLRFPS